MPKDSEVIGLSIVITEPICCSMATASSTRIATDSVISLIMNKNCLAIYSHAILWGVYKDDCDYSQLTLNYSYTATKRTMYEYMNRACMYTYIGINGTAIQMVIYKNTRW